MDAAVKSKISKSLGMIPSGCFVLTASDAGHSSGILASWVQQAGFDPPAVSVVIKHGRSIQSLVERSGHFVLNTIGEGGPDLLKHFAKGFETDEPAFEGLRTRTSPAGVILEDAVACLCCKVTGKVDAGDHTVYVATVIDGAVHRDGQPSVRIRTNGFNY
jgi:3-hydroxy-9,10-secoandrosta-1,3,5(10)-triene-9,17-dione monooxygenase reductase component